MTFDYPDLPGALCAEVDPELWFPERRGGEALYREARRICDICPEKASCLLWALAKRVPYGMWGGTTPRQRERLASGRAA